MVAEVHEEPLAAAVPADHPLRGRAVALDALVDARWIDAPAICAPLAELAAIARADGFRGALTYDGSDIAGLLALVAAGHGLALLPRRAVEHGLELAAPALVHRTELLRIGG
jgi:DNA-binding transcriptional LysR family regulator